MSRCRTSPSYRIKASGSGERPFEQRAQRFAAGVDSRRVDDTAAHGAMFVAVQPLPRLVRSRSPERPGPQCRRDLATRVRNRASRRGCARDRRPDRRAAHRGRPTPVRGAVAGGPDRCRSRCSRRWLLTARARAEPGAPPVNSSATVISIGPSRCCHWSGRAIVTATKSGPTNTFVTASELGRTGAPRRIVRGLGTRVVEPARACAAGEC